MSKKNFSFYSFIDNEMKKTKWIIEAQKACKRSRKLSLMGGFVQLQLLYNVDEDNYNKR